MGINIKKSILELKQITKKYEEITVLNNINIAIEKGIIHGFIGENGAGKTTTMNIICGLKKPSNGTVFFDNEELLYEATRTSIGYLPQHPKMYGYMKVKEYLDFILSLSPCDDIAINSETLLDVVGLTNEANKKVQNLSGGMMQRLGIASAISNNPKLVILDEPTSALDPEGRREIIDIIKKLKKRGMTVFFSTHLLTDVEHICDNITIIHKGNIVITAPLSEIKNKYGECFYEIEFNEEVDINFLENGCPSFISTFEKKGNSIILHVTNYLEDETVLYQYLISLKIGFKSLCRKELTLEDIYFKIIREGN